MLFITIPVSAKNFTYTHEGQTLTYTVIDEREKTCMVKPGETGWWGTTPGNAVSGSLEIPSSVSDGSSTYTVVRLGEYSFYGCSDITSITIPGSVTSIGKYCFFRSINNENRTVLTIEDGMGTLMLEDACFGNVFLSKLYLGRNLDYETGQRPIPSTFITSLTISNSVNIIGPELFKGARSLTSVKIPDSVVTIDTSAFESCSSLSYIEIPASVTIIGSSAFKGCSGLTSVEIPNSVTIINPSVFEGCSSLSAVKIPDFVTAIGSSAFKDCSSLTSVEIPNSVTEIGSSAFEGCSSLNSVILSNSITYIAENAFKGCALNSLTLPENIETIGIGAFRGCNLTSLTIPGKVNIIGSDAFADCENLKELILEDSTNGIICWGSFENCHIETAYIGRDIHDTNRSPLYNQKYLTSVTIGNLACSITSGAFDGCTSLKELRILDGTETLRLEHGMGGAFHLIFADNPLETVYIGRNLSYTTPNFRSPFYFVSNTLKELSFSNYVTWINDYAFRQCSELTSIEIPNSVTEIGISAFDGCTGLTSITLGNSVISINEAAFRNCSGLTSIEIPNSVTEIGISAFEDCAGLASVILGNSVTCVNDHAFEACSVLGSIEIPNSVTEIGMSAFKGCTGLVSITLGNSVTSIKEATFSGCSGLTSVQIPNSATSIGSSAFNGCSRLASVTLGTSIEFIDFYAFKDCNALSSIIIPKSVATIGSDAFPTIKDVTFEGAPETICADAFNHVVLLHINNANDWCNVYNELGVPMSNADLYIDGSQVKNLVLNPASKIVNNGCYSCLALDKVRIKADEIKDYAFYETAISALCLDVKKIGSWAFAYGGNLKEVYSMTPEPPVADGSSFEAAYAHFYEMTLYVPKGSMDEYRKHEYPWGQFGRIIETDFTDIDEMFKADYDDGSSGIEDVTINSPETFNSDKPYDIYTLNGVRVGNDIDSLSPGFYIVRQGNYMKKIAVR